MSPTYLSLNPPLIQSPTEASLPLLKVTVLDHNPSHTSSSSSNKPPGSSSSHPPISLKISGSHLKRLSPSLGVDPLDSRSLTNSPESTGKPVHYNRASEWMFGVQFCGGGGGSKDTIARFGHTHSKYSTNLPSHIVVYMPVCLGVPDRCVL